MRLQVAAFFRLIVASFIVVERIYANAGTGCLQSETGSEYLGTQNATSSGRPCVRWDEVQGAFRDYIRITFLALPDKNASNAKNYCRNPNNDSRGVWCFVNLLGNVQFCDVPRCATPSSAAPATKPTTKSTRMTTSTLLTKATTPYFRHSVWASEETPEIDDTISDYIKPVVMSNNFEELSAHRPDAIVTEKPILSTPKAIYLTLKQRISPYSGANNRLEVEAEQTTTTTTTRSMYQRRPFDEWEEDPVVESVSADAWEDQVPGQLGGINGKIFSEDAAVKIRTGSNLVLSGTADFDSDGAKVVIQRSSHLSSSAPSDCLLSLLLPFVLVVVVALKF